MARIKKTITSAVENMEKLEPSRIAAENVRWCNSFVKHFDSSTKKLNRELPFDPAIPLLGVYSRKLKTYGHIYIYTLNYHIATKKLDDLESIIRSQIQ